jgi:hypothetical protein
MRDSKIQELRFVPLEYWFLKPRPIARGPFWTPMQASFMMATQEGGVRLCAHRRIIVEGRAKSVEVIKEEMKGHLTYVPGLLDLLTRAHEYVLDWVKIFFTTLWIPRG